MARPGLLIYFDLVPALEKLPPASVGELLLTALHYAQDGVEPTFEETALEFAWAFLRPSIDRDGEAYENKRQRGDWLVYCRGCKKDGVEPLSFEDWKQHSVNGTLRRVDAVLPTTTSTQLQPNINSTTTSDIDKVADKPPTPAHEPRKRFVPPSLDEVKQYCDERDNGIDAQHFLDYYQARGWKYNGGQALKDWQAAIRTWERNGNSKLKQNDRNRVRTESEYTDSEDFFGGV